MHTYELFVLHERVLRTAYRISADISFDFCAKVGHSMLQVKAKSKRMEGGGFIKTNSLKIESCTRWELFPYTLYGRVTRRCNSMAALQTRGYRTNTHTLMRTQSILKKLFKLNKVGKTNKAQPGRWSKQHKSARGNAFSAIVVATECSCMHLRVAATGQRECT